MAPGYRDIRSVYKAMDKEEDIIKKTFYYRHNTLALACQKLKEEAMKAYSKPFLIVCAFIKGIQTAIIREREYNQMYKALSDSKVVKLYFATHIDPEIEKIQHFTPFTCKEAKEIYDVSQEYFIPIDLLVEFTIKSGLSAMAIKRILEKK